MANPLSIWLASALLLSIRIAPIFAFAPPFNLIMIPRLVRALLGIALATAIISANPAAMLPSADAGTIATAALREMLLGFTFVLALQLPFAAFNFIGRTIDIQAGYGIALLIDPATRTQVPLVGTLLSLLGGAAFFAMDGHLSLLRLLSASVQSIPLGQWAMPDTIASLSQFMSLLFLASFGVAGAVILALFLADLVVAVLSRTVPQMNVLVLGFQIKSILLLTMLPVAIGLGSATMLRMITMTFEHLRRLI